MFTELIEYDSFKIYKIMKQNIRVEFVYNAEIPFKIICYEKEIKKDEILFNESYDEFVYINYYINGNKQVEIWCNKQGLIHRQNNDPSYIKYDENGNKQVESWYREGRLYREDGPVRIKYEY